MIDQLTELTNKTNELEKKLQSLTEKQVSEESQTSCLSFSRNFSNLEIILPKKILVARVETNKNQNILLQCQLDLTLTNDESVEISLLANDFVIYKTYKLLSSGSSQISLMQNYKPLASKTTYIYVEIKPITQSPILLNHIALFAWGNLSDNSSVDYQGIEIGQNYMLSMLDNNCVYSLVTSKNKGEFNLVDFNFVDNSISHTFVYDSDNDIIYFFRVDLNGNLFYSNFSDRNEIFLASGVTNVSADISSSGKMLVTYVKNSECYFFEISETGVLSIHRKLYINSVKIKRVLCYFNRFRNKFILLLSSENDNNFLIEQIDEDYLNNETVTATYGFFVTSESV